MGVPVKQKRWESVSSFVARLAAVACLLDPGLLERCAEREGPQVVRTTRVVQVRIFSS